MIVYDTRPSAIPTTESFGDVENRNCSIGFGEEVQHLLCLGEMTAALAQLERAAAYNAGGCEFKPCT